MDAASCRFPSGCWSETHGLAAADIHSYGHNIPRQPSWCSGPLTSSISSGSAGDKKQHRAREKDPQRSAARLPYPSGHSNLHSRKLCAFAAHRITVACGGAAAVTALLCCSSEYPQRQGRLLAWMPSCVLLNRLVLSYLAPCHSITYMILISSSLLTYPLSSSSPHPPLCVLFVVCAQQQIFAAAAVILLGVCAVAFVVSSYDASPQEDAISNIYAGYVSCSVDSN
jgi:hypothetical protein